MPGFWRREEVWGPWPWQLCRLKPQANAPSKEDHLLTGKGLNTHPAQAFLLFFFSSGGQSHGIIHILGTPQVGLANFPEA